MSSVEAWTFAKNDGSEATGNAIGRRFVGSGSSKSIEVAVWTSQGFGWKGSSRLGTSNFAELPNACIIIDQLLEQKVTKAPCLTKTIESVILWYNYAV